MSPNDRWLLDSTKAFALVSLCVFIVSTWLAVRAKAASAKRVAALLSIVSGLTLLYYGLLAPVAD